MTTCSYTLVLDDSECIALEAALSLLLERCEKELTEGPRAPYWAWRESARGLKARLYGNVQQTSGHRFARRPEGATFPPGASEPEDEDRDR